MAAIGLLQAWLRRRLLLRRPSGGSVAAAHLHAGHLKRVALRRGGAQAAPTYSL